MSTQFLYNTMESLVAVLRMIEASEDIVAPDDLDTLISEEHRLVRHAQNLATTYLVTDIGTPNFVAMDELFAKYGYFVFPGERGTLGWVSACLQTKKGIIMFG